MLKRTLAILVMSAASMSVAYGANTPSPAMPKATATPVQDTTDVADDYNYESDIGIENVSWVAPTTTLSKASPDKIVKK